MINPELLYEYDKKILFKKVPEGKTLRVRIINDKVVQDHYPENIIRKK